MSRNYRIFWRIKLETWCLRRNLKGRCMGLSWLLRTHSLGTNMTLFRTDRPWMQACCHFRSRALGYKIWCLFWICNFLSRCLPWIHGISSLFNANNAHMYSFNEINTSRNYYSMTRVYTAGNGSIWVVWFVSFHCLAESDNWGWRTQNKALSTSKLYFRNLYIHSMLCSLSITSYLQKFRI